MLQQWLQQLQRYSFAMKCDNNKQDSKMHTQIFERVYMYSTISLMKIHGHIKFKVQLAQSKFKARCPVTTP